MPAGHLLGPMLVTALFSVGMNYRIFLPDILIVVAQVIIGTSLGARFFGMDKNILWTATRLSLISVISMLILAFLFVMALQYLSVITPMTLFISFAPGGVTEMSLIALSVASSPALVSAHHIFRIIITVSLLGVIYNRWIKELN
jgi:membrane AbrB-like protein